MKQTEELKKIISEYHVNQLIDICELYESRFAESMSFSAFTKNIERYVANGYLIRVAKGTYCRPNTTKYGIVFPSEQEMLKEFVGENKGVVIGYYLYNELNISTQIAKHIEAYSNAIKQFSRTISNISIEKCNLQFTDEEITTVRMLEILKNFYNIQDLNYKAFVLLCNKFAEQYNEKIVNKVIEQMRYSKSTIAFMQHILSSAGVKNNLKKYLSESSTYKYPKMEQIYDLAQL